MHGPLSVLMNMGITFLRNTGYAGPDVKTSRLSRNWVAASTFARDSGGIYIVNLCDNGVDDASGLSTYQCPV